MKTHRWNPNLVGALIGVLSILIFTLADKPIGMSTGIAQASGACALPVLGADGVAANTYSVHIPARTPGRTAEGQRDHRLLPERPAQLLRMPPAHAARLQSAQPRRFMAYLQHRNPLTRTL